MLDELEPLALPGPSHHTDFVYRGVRASVHGYDHMTWVVARFGADRLIDGTFARQGAGFVVLGSAEPYVSDSWRLCVEVILLRADHASLVRYGADR